MSTFSAGPPDQVAALISAVDRTFDAVGADTPGWPDPHPDGQAPLEDEYSRVSDVGKYRILDARVDAWAAVLADKGLADVRDMPATTWIAACRPATDHLRVRRMVPRHAGGLSLLFATTRVDDAPFGLDVAIAHDGTEPVFVEMVPSCGCDACDHGSADLLDTLDGWVLTVARGGVVHARKRDLFATRTPHGWTTSGGHESWLDERIPTPTGVRRWAGTPWL